MEASFRTFRHIRRANRGGVTVCCDVFPKRKEMVVGFSFCSPEDLNQFSKKRGRDDARARLEMGGGITIQLYTDGGRLNIVKSLFIHLRRFVLGSSGFQEMGDKVKEFLGVNPYSGDSGAFYYWLTIFVASL